MKLVSIVMPTYNAERTIAQAIESVKNQTYNIWELIIINDASTDNTLQIILPYLADNRIKLINSQHNNGLPTSRNLGMAESIGQFITFLDSDDLWHPLKLSTQIEFHHQNPSISISHSNFERFDSNGIIGRPWKIISEMFVKRRGILLPQLYYKNSIGILTVMLKKELLAKIGNFDTKLWTFEDQDLWIRIALTQEKFGYINKILAYYRLSSGGMVNNIGKYKKSYKVLINKYKNEILDKNILKLVYANYNRYFGTVFYKRQQHDLASYYFIKSLFQFGFNFNSLTTFIYLIINQFKKYTYK